MITDVRSSIYMDGVQLTKFNLSKGFMTLKIKTKHESQKFVDWGSALYCFNLPNIFDGVR